MFYVTWSDFDEMYENQSNISREIHIFTYTVNLKTVKMIVLIINYQIILPTSLFLVVNEID